MRQEVIEKFKDFEKELEKLKSANEHIGISKRAAENSLKLLEGSSQKLITKLDDVAKSIGETHTDHIISYKSDYDRIKSDLIKYYKETNDLTNKLLNSLIQPTDMFSELSEKSKSIIQKIDTINFPERLDKLENSVNTNFSDILEFNREVNKQSQVLIEEINQINFKALIDELKKSIVESTEKIVEYNAKTENRIKKQSEIQNAFTEKLTQEIEELKIPTRISNLEKSLEKFLAEIHDLNYETHYRITELVKFLDGINISHRLDKLDASIAGINQSIQTLIQRFEPLERNLKESLYAKTSEILNNQNQINQRNEEIFKDHFEGVSKSDTELFKELKSIKKENQMIKILLAIALALSSGLIIIQFI